MNALPKAVHGRPRGFIDWRPQAKTADLIRHIELVLDEYREHLPLTCRQVFYRLVGKYGYEKTESSYSRLCEVLNRARRARLIGFDAIRDDGFSNATRTGWAGVADVQAAIRDSVETYRIDRQRGQERRVVLWCEASGMVPQLERVGSPYSVPVYSSGGFDSVTVKHDMAEQFAESGPVLVLHIGDHDPSGVHVFGSLAEDVTAFGLELGAVVEFSRLAVLPEHIDEFGLPTAPPKTTDRRVFVGQTVQAEALPPDVLAELVQAAIVDNIDMDTYQRALEMERAERKELQGWLA